MEALEHTFSTVLVGDMGPHRWTCAIVEGSPEILGTGKAVRVRADIDGVITLTSLLPYRGRHMLPVKQAILNEIGKTAGDTVRVTIIGA
ncbi:DUF1905 domain-containing protein [Microbacterium pygmaeum]|uniref:DUF1905 domain-containing protein n=1 Tax=Microbacterium pygmaeum TaxID=370764 RepID=A0A1G8DGL6_9MICO|nr:DUF1905 domain-containing protein [Microbacterium pygmaeum]SDH56589.1 protein of unknown function [Microbacterium pygmaeum]